MADTGRFDGDHMIRGSILLASLIALCGIGCAPASAAGGWKYQVIPNDGHVLTYSEADRVTFYLGCGRSFALHVKYPGEAKKDGKAHITIANETTKMEFDGEFEEPFDAKDPVPMNFATQFRQSYLGYAKQDDRVYGKKWLALRSQFYALLGSGEPLTISAGKDSYQLPPVDAANWRKPFATCGLGGSW
jgi:hypothetical protein